MRNKILLNSGALYNYGLGRFFEIAKAAGFDGIELTFENNWDLRQPEYIKKLEKENKIKVLSVHSAMEFVTCWGEDPKIRLEESIKLAKEIGAKVFVIHPHDYLDRKFYQWVRDNFPKIISEAIPMAVVFENSTTRAQNWRPAKFSYFPKIALDTSHIATTGQNLLKITKKIKGRIFHIHLSDSDFKKRPDKPKLIADRHLLPGAGKLPLKEFLHTLKKIKYSGYIVLELLPENVGAGESDQKIIENLVEARKFIEKNLKT